MIPGYEIFLSAQGGAASYAEGEVKFLAAEGRSDAAFAMTFAFPEWEKDAYIFLPACVYGGNQMEKRYGDYPVSYAPSDLSEHPAAVISDIPALSPLGEGKIEVTAADLSVPCFGVYFRESGAAILVFTEALCKDKRIGFSVEKGRIAVQFPAMRERAYRMCNSAYPSADSGFAVCKGEAVRTKVRILPFACASLPEFFSVFFENRRALLSDAPVHLAYTPALRESVEAHMNRDCFSGAYYSEMNKNFKCGWVGGALSALALLGCGTEISRKNAEKTLDFMTSHTSPAGFFYGYFADGRKMYDGGRMPHMEGAMLVRKNADGLAALLKILLRHGGKEAWRKAAKRCADGFLRIYDRYGQFGHYVHIETGEMMVGGTASGAAAIGALALAFRLFGEEKYLRTARLAGEKYYGDFARFGMTYGGPSDSLCAPDSESAYALLESIVLLYECDRDEKWLEYAKNCLYYLSTWVMPYAFPFPKGCEFSRLSVNTVGSVFANAQNKHSSPGLCTASGDAIYRLYRYTGDRRILRLILEITAFIPQCVSTEARPIFSRDKEPQRLLDGWICERVNTSDWEGEEAVGGVFAYPCWPATTLLLCYAELILNEDFLRDAQDFYEK